MLISEEYRKLRGDVLLHFTPIENDWRIRDLGAIYSSNMLIPFGLIPEYMTDETSRSIDKHKGNNNYVFLTFSNQHPLIYRISKYEKRPLINYKIDVSILDLPGVKIADRVATDNNVTLYTVEEALYFLKIPHCHGQKIHDRKIWNEVIKYEILIPDMIDLQKFLRRV